MIQIAVALTVGIIFALGLSVSEMINPARVIGFLDVTGRWDPTLLLVMAGALAVTIPGFPLILRRPKPFLAPRFSLPTKSRIDPPVILGAAIFGVGWWPGRLLSRTGTGCSGLGITAHHSICACDAAGTMVGIALRRATV